MIASSARLAAPLSRQALRQASRQGVRQPALSPFQAPRRMASGTAKAATEQAKSDAPWAIGSLLVFGGMFIYLTSPPAGGKKGHGHDDHSEDSDHGSKTKDGKPNGGAMKSDFEAPNKVESKPDQDSDAPAGSRSLAERSLTAEDGAQLQKKTKESSSGRADDITFKKGVAAAKEGHSGKEDSHMSDPKKVVAAAKDERQQKKESKDVHGSVEAADANANNEKDEGEDEESQDVHDSENAKKANEINEAEGSDKA